MPELTCDIDGTDVSAICQSQSWRPRLNLLDAYVIRFPSYLFAVSPGVMELHGYLDGDLVFSGPIWFMQPDGGVDSAYTEVTAYDHRVYLSKLLAKWDDGGDDFNLIDPCTVFTDNVKAPLILAEFITNAINDPASADFDPTGPEGPFGPALPLPLGLGTVDSGGENVDSCPMDFPMTIQRVASLLVATGELDIILNPGIGSSTVDLLNHYDNDISGSVVFEYATGSHNSQIASVTVDMDDMINALWFLLGPRGPRDVIVDGRIRHIPRNHWGGSITPTAPNATGDVWDSALLNLIGNSRAIYGYMQEVQIHDDNGDEQTIRRTFEEWWAAEAEVRALPREFLSVRPARGLAPNFRVGDRIGVAAGADLNGGVLGFGGDQIVYGFNATQDTEVLSIDEIITSADQSLTG